MIDTNDNCEYKAFFDEGISFYKSAQIVQGADSRVCDDEIDLFSPIVFLLRHAAELLLKSLIIKVLFKSGISEWQSFKLSSSNRKLSSTHSLSELYSAWRELDEAAGLAQDEIEILEEYVYNINCYDEDSTFFRYPIDKKGSRNRKAMTETVDKEVLDSLPCHLGALVCAKGSENFYCLHRGQFMDPLEFDMVELIRLLIRIFEKQ